MVRARYDAVADFYITEFDSVGNPASLALLDPFGPVAGLHVVDVARGHGRIARELARRGADVTGLDILGTLISKAWKTEQNEPLGIRYIHADVTAPGALREGEFDAAACNFGLSDIDDLDAGIAAVRPVPGWCLGGRRLTAASRWMRAGTESFSSCVGFTDVQSVDGLGELSGAPRAAA